MIYITILEKIKSVLPVSLWKQHLILENGEPDSFFDCCSNFFDEKIIAIKALSLSFSWGLEFSFALSDGYSFILQQLFELYI